MYEFTLHASYPLQIPCSWRDKEIKNGNRFTVIAIVIVNFAQTGSVVETFTFCIKFN